MRLGGLQTVYSCEEHKNAQVPIGELLVDGNLDIYPSVTGRGYFDIDYREGKLILHATKYVGLIPISDRVAIHVRPKTPIGNLLWMVWRARAPVTRFEGVIRSYQISGAVDDAESVYVKTFMNLLEEVAQKGPIKRYHQRESEVGWRGRLSFSRSVSRFYARGVRHQNVFVQTDLTTDILENQIIKSTALRLRDHLRRDRGGEGERLSRRITESLAAFASVNERLARPDVIARETPRLIRGLPSSHAHYEAALWLAYLIATRSGVALERVGEAKFESVIVNVADIFEDYVRRVCAEAQESVLRCVVRDGNKKPVPLFTSGPAVVKPDLYFQRGDRTVAVADAKYKNHPTVADRYELLAFCEATGVKRAAFICPMWPGMERESHFGTTQSGLRVDLFRVDLAAPDMEVEERRLLANIQILLTSQDADI